MTKNTISISKFRDLTAASIFRLVKPVLVTSHDMPLAILVDYPRDDTEIADMALAVRELIQQTIKPDDK